MCIVRRVQHAARATGFTSRGCPALFAPRPHTGVVRVKIAPVEFHYFGRYENVVLVPACGSPPALLSKTRARPPDSLIFSVTHPPCRGLAGCRGNAGAGAALGLGSAVSNADNAVPGSSAAVSIPHTNASSRQRGADARAPAAELA